MPRYMPIVLLMFALFCGCSGPKTDNESTASQQVQYGSDMIAAAQIYFNTRNHPITLQSLKQHLGSKLGGSYSLTEWKGYAISIPQLLVEGNPSWTLQIDGNADYLPAEIKELADQAGGILDDKQQAILRACNARLDAMAHQGPLVSKAGDRAITLRATTSLDPSHPMVRKVLNEVAAYVEGLVYDAVNGQWITK